MSRALHGRLPKDSFYLTKARIAALVQDSSISSDQAKDDEAVTEKDTEMAIQDKNEKTIEELSPRQKALIKNEETKNEKRIGDEANTGRQKRIKDSKELAELLRLSTRGGRLSINGKEYHIDASCV